MKTETLDRPTRLVTFLGANKYEEVVYRLDGKEAMSTCHVARALCDLLPVREVVVLATQLARQRNGAALEASLSALPGVTLRLEPIPDGRSEEELWTQFRILQEAVAGAQGGVVLDITHGFRSQPFFAAAGIALLRMAGRLPDPFRIVYGAYDARGEDGVAPLWDLTLVTELLAWAHGAAVFTATGHGGPLVEVARRADSTLRRALAERRRRGEAVRFPDTNRLIGALEAFSADLAAVRIAHLVTGYEKEPRHKAKAQGSAHRLLEALDAYGREVAEHLPALGPVLEQVREVACGLPASTLWGNEGQRAMARLARRYLAFRRYPEAAIVLREALVSRHGPPEGVEVNCEGYDRCAREQAERRWGDADRDAQRAVAKVRNDIEHGGFNDDPMPAGALATELAKLIDRHLPEAERPGAPPRVWFVTRHPGAREWAQRHGIHVDEMVDHLEPADVGEGDLVIGTLPVHLVAAIGRRGAHYLHLSLDLPPELRGRELDAEELERCNARLEPYRVLPGCRRPPA